MHTVQGAIYHQTHRESPADQKATRASRRVEQRVVAGAAVESMAAAAEGGTSYAAVDDAMDDDDRGQLLGPNDPRGSTTATAGSTGASMFPGRRQREEEELSYALPRGMLLAVFICLYSGFSLRLLNSAEHLPRFWINNPHTMEGLSQFLLVGAGVISSAYVVLLAVSPGMRPECTRGELCKANRLAGYLLNAWVTASLLSLPYLTFLFYEVKHFRPQDTAWFVAFVFALLTVVYSLREIIKHLQNFSLPELQTNIVRILLMPPIYAVASFLQLRMLQQGVYIGAVRELYEAFTVYSFMHLMTDFMQKLADLEGDGVTVVTLMNDPQRGAGVDRMHHRLPVSLLEKAGWIKPWAMQSPDSTSCPFYDTCKRGVLQYVPVACFCAVMASTLELLGGYHEAQISLHYGWFYLCLLRNLSQFVALYCLVMFYSGAKKLLDPLHPLSKFLSIKLIIFFTFWQKLVLIALKHFDLLPVHSLYESEYISGAVNTTHGIGISTWGDDISSPELFNDLASAGIQNL
jgi:hypothetical protein